MPSKATPQPYLRFRRLLAVVSAPRRDLPWRHTRDPYHVLVSEVMLQQTQVAGWSPTTVGFSKSFRR